MRRNTLENQVEIRKLNSEKSVLISEMENKQSFAIELVESVFEFVFLAREDVNQVPFKTVLSDLDPFFSYPCLEIHQCIFNKLCQLKSNKIELFDDPEVISKVLGYTFNLLKKRNFEVFLSTFSDFFKWIIQLCHSISMELFYSCFKIFSKLLANSSVR